MAFAICKNRKYRLLIEIHEIRKVIIGQITVSIRTAKIASHIQCCFHFAMYVSFKNKEFFGWLKEYLQSFFLLGFAYAGIYFLNNALTGFLYLAPAAHLVHIPSGFKLLFVLIGRWAAAAAIACGLCERLFPDLQRKNDFGACFGRCKRPCTLAHLVIFQAPSPARRKSGKYSIQRYSGYGIIFRGAQ